MSKIKIQARVYQASTFLLRFVRRFVGKQLNL